jgi:hypothetical protein
MSAGFMAPALSPGLDEVVGLPLTEGVRSDRYLLAAMEVMRGVLICRGVMVV